MADVLVRNEGTVVLLTPKSVEARAWVDENLGLESWQWVGDSFAVEWRYAPNVVDGMIADGLEVIPESHEITDEDLLWLAELHITVTKTVAEPQVSLREEAEPDTTDWLPTLRRFSGEGWVTYAFALTAEGAVGPIAKPALSEVERCFREYPSPGAQ